MTTPFTVRSLSLLCTTAIAACVPMTGSTLPPPCEVQPGSVEQAIYVPPLAIELQVPTADGGVLLCTPGTGDECEQLLEENCVAATGAVSVGTSDDVAIVLRNISGTETLEIDSVSFTSDSDPAFELTSAAPADIGPEETVTLTVEFSPMAPGEHTAGLVVVSNAVNAQSGSTAIRIVGTAVE